MNDIQNGVIIDGVVYEVYFDPDDVNTCKRCALNDLKINCLGLCKRVFASDDYIFRIKK